MREGEFVLQMLTISLDGLGAELEILTDLHAAESTNTFLTSHNHPASTEQNSPACRLIPLGKAAAKESVVFVD
jgi:hypothetical protein